MSLDPSTLRQYVIYDQPLDAPDAFVVRIFDIIRGEIIKGPAWTCTDLKTARSKVPPGLYCLPRFEGDDPCIVEVWL